MPRRERERERETTEWPLERKRQSGDNEAETKPWHPQPALHQTREPDELSEVSRTSHRRRRLHAACDED